MAFLRAYLDFLHFLTLQAPTAAAVAVGGATGKARAGAVDTGCELFVFRGVLEVYSLLFFWSYAAKRTSHIGPHHCFIVMIKVEYLAT